jgi:hypothetical protein
MEKNGKLFTKQVHLTKTRSVFLKHKPNCSRVPMFNKVNPTEVSDLENFASGNLFQKNCQIISCNL